MATIHDVAAFILTKAGAMTAMKLQKLVYYSQAWSLVWDEAPLFPERIEAWANGPVSPALYDLHRGQFMLSDWPQGNAAALTPMQADTVERVIDSYAKYSSQQLSDLTHREAPWLNARCGVPATERSDAEITQAAMAEYYESLSDSSESTAL